MRQCRPDRDIGEVRELQSYASMTICFSNVSNLAIQGNNGRYDQALNFDSTSVSMMGCSIIDLLTKHDLQYGK